MYGSLTMNRSFNLMLEELRSVFLQTGGDLHPHSASIICRRLSMQASAPPLCLRSTPLDAVEQPQMAARSCSKAGVGLQYAIVKLQLMRPPPGVILVCSEMPLYSRGWLEIALKEISRLYPWARQQSTHLSLGAGA